MVTVYYIALKWYLMLASYDHTNHEWRFAYSGRIRDTLCITNILIEEKEVPEGLGIKNFKIWTQSSIMVPAVLVI